MNLFKSIKATRLSDVERKKSEFILKDILPIPRRTVNMISSFGGMGKTFLSIRLANEFVKENKANVLCWFSEDYNGEIGIRFDSMVSNRMIVESYQDKIFLIDTEPIQFAIKDRGIFKANYDALNEIKKDCLINEIKFIIIDPLLAFYGGDENDNSQARIFMQPFVEWAKQEDITILFIHHSSKSGNGTRGAGAFRDAVRTLYEMNYILDEDGELDFDKKDAGVRELSLAKDNRNAYYWFEKKYGSGVAEVQILPRRVINVIETEFKFEMDVI